MNDSGPRTHAFPGGEGISEIVIPSLLVANLIASLQQMVAESHIHSKMKFDCTTLNVFVSWKANSLSESANFRTCLDLNAKSGLL